MIRNIVRGCLGAAIAFAFCSAQGAQLQLTGWSNGHVRVDGATPSVHGEGGQFVGKLDGSPFYTYCVELTQHFGLPMAHAYDFNVMKGTDYFTNRAAQATVIVDRLGKLFTHLSGIGEKVNLKPSSTLVSGAIQMAIWEAVSEGNNPLTLDSGDFYATSGDLNKARDLANDYLTAASNLSSQDASYYISRIRVLERSDMQDFLMIPEPGSLALAGIALGALVLSRRRRV